VGIVWQWEIVCLSAAIKWLELNVTMLSVLGSYILWAMVCCFLWLLVAMLGGQRSITESIFNCCMQDAMKQILLIKMKHWILQVVQTEDLWTAHPFLVVWSAIMGPLQDLGQTTSVMMVLFWRGIKPQESARVMAIGMGAYPGALQRNQVCMFVLLSPSAQRYIHADWFKCKLYSIVILLQSLVSSTWRLKFLQSCHTCSFLL